MKILITGGAGFIGCNTTKCFREAGWDVTVLDNLSRLGSEKNLDWLRSQISLEFINADIRDVQKIADVVTKGYYDAIIHLAAQVAVTTSVISPRLDFEVNALGTFNILEAIRCQSPKTVLLNASSNKVYGQLSELTVRENEKRYEYIDRPLGVSETQPLDFHSPYGCSKGAAEQYVIDYARIYGLRCINFRQSCIYGYRQFGIEEQGWLAWFTIAHILGKPIKVYGNGKQVRDVLFIDDLVAAYRAAIEMINSISGQTFNIGGGGQNTLSLLELISYLENLSGRNLIYSMADWRPGDQPIYVSDIRRASKILNWAPRTTAKAGVAKLYDWIMQNKSLFNNKDGK
jgi:CDP-paratose 2-epimerase